MSSVRKPLPGDVLLHPVALGALFTWAFNDHVLKKVAPGLLSGKLSDVASLVFFPLLATTCVMLCFPRSSEQVRRAVLLGFATATAGVMAAINTLDPAAAIYRWGMGIAQWPLRALNALLHVQPPPALHPVALTMDGTDLATLPAAALAVVLAWNRS